MPPTYKLTDAFFAHLRLRVLLLVIPLVLLAVGGGWFAAGADTDPTTLIPFGLLVGATVAFSLWRGLRRQLASFRTLRIELTEDSIVRTQENYPPLELRWAEVVGVFETPGKGITVRGRGSEQFLFLPRTLERFEDLRERVNALRPLEVRASSRQGYLVLVAAVVTVLVVLVVLARAQTPAYVLPAGTLLIVGMVVCDRLIRRSQHVDERLKKGRFGLALVCLFAAIKMWSVLAR
jgi:hypothetical protein